MSKNGNLLFVIADGEHVRFVRPAQGRDLHSVATLESAPAHNRSASRDTNVTHPAENTGCHPLPPCHDMYALEKARFGREVAARLNAEAVVDGFEELVIVAPYHTLVEIRQRLNAAADAKIVGTLPKDLASTPDDELWPHLRGWLQAKPARKIVRSTLPRG